MPNLDQIALDTVEAIANIDPDKLKGGRVQAVAQAQCLVRDAMRVVEADRDALDNRVDFLNQQNSAQQEQNDALAAHVEEVRDAYRREIPGLYGNDERSARLVVVGRALNQSPEASLSHLKVEWLKGINQQSRRVRDYWAPDKVFVAVPLTAIDCELRRQQAEESKA